jgi:hypothetical protein
LKAGVDFEGGLVRERMKEKGKGTHVDIEQRDSIVFVEGLRGDVVVVGNLIQKERDDPEEVGNVDGHLLRQVECGHSIALWKIQVRNEKKGE